MEREASRRRLSGKKNRSGQTPNLVSIEMVRLISQNDSEPDSAEQKVDIANPLPSDINDTYLLHMDLVDVIFSFAKDQWSARGTHDKLLVSNKGRKVTKVGVPCGQCELGPLYQRVLDGIEGAQAALDEAIAEQKRSGDQNCTAALGDNPCGDSGRILRQYQSIRVSHFLSAEDVAADEYSWKLRIMQDEGDRWLLSIGLVTPEFKNWTQPIGRDDTGNSICVNAYNGFWYYKNEALLRSFGVGDKVSGFWKNGRWYDATIEAENCDGTYKIRWTADNKVTERQRKNELRVPGFFPIRSGVVTVTVNFRESTMRIQAESADTGRVTTTPTIDIREIGGSIALACTLYQDGQSVELIDNEMP